MLTADQLDTLSDPIVSLYREFELSIIRDIARRLKKMSAVTATAAWQMQRLNQSGAVYANAIRQLAKLTGMSESKLRTAFRDAGVRSMRFDDKIYKAAGLQPLPLNLSPQMAQVLTAGLQKTNGSIRNLTLTTAIDAQNKFIHAADLAYLQVTSGTMTPEQAIRSAIRSLGGSGLEVLYPTGRRDKLDVAMRRAVITGVNQTVGRLQLTRANEMQQDLIAVSAHIGARNAGVGPANHESWQGQIYSRSGTHPKYPPFVERTGFGTIVGLCGVNCRHSFYPFFDGISQNVYDEATLKRYANKKVKYNGQVLSFYEATQQQRAIERKIREWKLKAAALEAAGLDNKSELARVRTWQAQMRSFVRQTGLSRQPVRESIIKGGNAALTPFAPVEPGPEPTPVVPIVGPQPQGTPVTEALDISGIKDPAVRAQVELALREMDKVHGDGQLPRIPIKVSSARRNFGQFVSSGITPLRITVAKSGDHKALTTLHEIGHFLDHRGFGVRALWSTRYDTLGGKIVKVTRASDWYKNIWQRYRDVNSAISKDIPPLTIGRSYVNYLLSPKELFARAYAQYIATKSGNSELLRQLKAQQGSKFTTQWTDADFEPIMDEFDALFREIGWIA